MREGHVKGDMPGGGLSELPCQVEGVGQGPQAPTLRGAKRIEI